jgi:hypothetical protein
MDYSKEQEIKRIQEMIRKLEAEQAGEASYEQAADLSSIASTDPQPIVLDSPSDAPAFCTAMSLSDMEGPVTPVPAAEAPAKHAAQAPAQAVEVPEKHAAPAPAPVAEPAATPAPAPVAETAAPVSETVKVQLVTPSQAVETTPPATEPMPTPAAEQPVAPIESAAPVTETASVQSADKAASEQPAKPAVQNAAPAEAQPAETAQAEAKTEDATSADEAKTKDGKKKKKRRKLRLSKGTIFIAVLAECMLLIIAIFVFTHSVPLNSDDDVVYSDPNQVDVITCADGTLNVNNVSVSVPPENATYNISYTWGRKDEDYPTVPHSVTSSYYGKDGNLMYDISLYRESLTKPADIPEGKDASNWFTDWATDDSETNLHKPMDSGSIHGFLVSSVEDIEEGATGTTYGSTSYYFALQDEEGLSIYVLESILYDKASLEAYRKVMDDCIKSIKVSQKTV